MPVFWWMSLDLVFLLGRTTSGGVFWGVCELILILDCLSTNGWGCVPVKNYLCQNFNNTEVDKTCPVFMTGWS